MIYNLTEISANLSQSGTGGLVAYNNVLFDGILGIIACVVLVIFFFGLYQLASRDPLKSLVAAAWTVFPIAFGLRILNLLNNYALFGMIAICATLLALLIWAGQER